MNKPIIKNILLSLVLLFNTGIALSQDNAVQKIHVYLPSFKTYKADSIYTGKGARINFNSNPQFKLFRTMIKNGYRNNKLNFGGYYCFTWWGCGSSCQHGIIIDLITGAIYDGPTAGCGFKFNIHSRMIMVNPPGKDNLITDYAVATIPEVWVLNEQTKAFVQKKVRFYPALHQGPRED